MNECVDPWTAHRYVAVQGCRQQVHNEALGRVDGDLPAPVRQRAARVRGVGRGCDDVRLALHLCAIAEPELLHARVCLRACLRRQAQEQGMPA